jgi:hypothetical protein
LKSASKHHYLRPSELSTTEKEGKVCSRIDVLGNRSPARCRQSNGRTRRKLSPVRQRANVRSKNSTINTRNCFLPQMSTIPTEVEDARFDVPSGNATQAGWISEAESGEDEAAVNRSPSEGARFVRASQRQKQS